ncbi:fungal-specific transcription factor domain-containing protein [Apiospora hydei]|uniref:Fungal-specific transcription factor domain-containing protein n=1 Tax=Apiospora hydei TaxID=1337664 RepID=A0ABR1VGM4_9PEZI
MTTINVASPTPTPPRHRRQSSQSQGAPRSSRQQPGLACEECRRRKLRCDRKTPSCKSCFETGVVCVMPATAPPRGPKRGHLRCLPALESRLKEQNETAWSHHSHTESEDGSYRDPASPPALSGHHRDYSSDSLNTVPMSIGMPATPSQSTATPPPTSITWASPMIDPSLMFMDDTMDGNYFSLQSHTPNFNEMAVPVGLHLTPLVCTDLDQLYFDRVHVFAPMIHKDRYRSWTKQIDKPKRQLCLQYAMWTMAASLSSQFQMVRDGLYSETRRLLDALELEPTEFGTLSLDYAQAWILIAIYEWTINDCNRFLMSAGRAFRSIQLLRLHELDCSPTPTPWTGDWVELESARRTFWVAFDFDCFTAIHNGLPLTFNEQEIRTRLPVPESQFLAGRSPVTMPFLDEIMASCDSARASPTCDFPTSPLVECIFAASLCGRNVTHKQRSLVEQCRGEVVTEDFCRRHQSLDALLTSRIKSLGAACGQDFSLLTDPSLIFAALVAHMNVLFLREVIDSMMLETEMSHALRTQQEQKAFLAAEQMGKLATAVSNLDRFQSHFFTAIPLSMAARFYMLHSVPEGDCSPHLQTICAILQNITGINSNLSNGFQLSSVPPLEGV